mgnify:CR=1 FL=1
MKSSRLLAVAKNLVVIDRLLLAALILLAAIALLIPLPFLPVTAARLVEDYLAEIVLLGTTCVLFATAAVRGRDAASGNFWTLMTAAFACWLLSTLFGFFFDPQSPWLNDFLKDILLLMMSCLVVVAADLRPGLIKSPLQALRARLAAISSVLLIVGVFGYAALVPALAGIEQYRSPFVVYAVLDTYIALRFLVQGLQSTSRAWRAIMLLVAAGFALISCADLLVAVYNAGWLTYVPGSPLNVGWFLFYAPLFLASRVEPGPAQFVPRAERDDWSDTLTLTPLVAWTIAVPLIHLGGYGLGYLNPESRAVRDLFVLFWLLGAGAGLTWQYLLLRGRLRTAERARIDAEHESAELQHQLRQAQRIDLIGQLSGGLAHEFGNSLFGAESYAQRILKDAQNDAARVREEHAAGLVQALAASRELVRKFDFLGRGEELQTSVVNVVGEVGETLDLLRRGLPGEVRLSFHHDGDDIGVIARSQDLQQVTMNLVLNARDAIGAQGFIDVHVGQALPGDDTCTSCGALVTGEQVFIRVSDSGPGVPQHLRLRVFEPLVSTKEKGAGSGLGLSIVHTLVHQLRGHIVLSEPQRAHCSFTVLLPALHLDAPARPAAAAQADRRLLVVESSRAVAEAFQRNRALHALSVSRVTSAEAAAVVLRQADGATGTVIIGAMPNPLDVVAIVEAARAAGDLRVILCAPRPLRRQLATLDGIDSYLDQPIEDAGFVASVMRPHAA